MLDKRRVQEGKQAQGSGESLIYTLTTTPWGSAPTGVAVDVYDVTTPSTREDVTDDVLTGTSSVAGDIITLPALHSLEDGHRYEVRIAFTDDEGNTWEAIADIQGVL